MEFRTLNANEIECRVSTISEKGCSLLLYKDARADMNLLDETVGPQSWQRKHELINDNLFCSVGINCDGEWIWKQDVGKESNTEAEKGQASDAFKRACVNWGIGRELYTAPFIWIPAEKVNLQKKGDKYTTYDRFKVTHIEYDEYRTISQLEIVNTNNGEVVYNYGGNRVPKQIENVAKKATKTKTAKQDADDRARVLAYFNRHEMTADALNKICKFYKVGKVSELTAEHCRHYITKLEQSGGSIDE